MSWFNNLSIRIKILSIAIIALMGFVLYWGANFYASQIVARHLSALQNNDMPSLSRINVLAADLLGLRESYLTATAEKNSDLLAAAQEKAVAIEKVLAEPMSSSPIVRQEQKKLFDQFSTYNQYASSLAQETIAGTLSNEHYQMALRELTEQRLLFDDQLDATRRAVYDGFVQKIDEVTRSNEELWRLGVVVGILVAVLVFGLTVLVTRRMIIGPLNQAVEAANRIAEGDWAVPIVSTANDELGHMLRSIQKMRDKLKSRHDEDKRTARIKSTVAELGNRMRGDMTMKQLSENILNYLVPALNGHVGLLYLPRKDEFVIGGSYAYTFREQTEGKVKLGEGLVGQAALEKKPMVLTRVPPNYLTIGSGLGETSPRHIIVTPILYEGAVSAILEIGSLNEPNKEDLEILQMSIEQMAVAINASASRKQLSEMLAQTSSQAEQLRVQQEVMAEINRDLEEQTVALSASEMRLQEQQYQLKAANEELEEQTQALKASEEGLQAQQEELRVINEELEAQTRLLADQRNELLLKNEALNESRQVLEDKTKALELSGKYKSEFLSTMSHELRTPLNSILILSQSLADNKAGNLTEKQTEHAHVIHSAGSDLLSLINDILDIAKVEEGKMELVIESLATQDIADHFRKMFDHMAQHKGLNFSVNLDKATPAAIQTDRQRLEQVVKNFISNAFKFTAQGGVSLNIGPAPAGTAFHRIDGSATPVIAISVVDTGIGVAKEKQGQIFEAFQQADGTTSRKYGGTGLGLTISREFSHLLGGEIQLFSEGEGRGSTFTLFLPVNAPVGASEVVFSVASPTDKTSSIPTLFSQKSDKKSLIIIEDDDNFSDVLMELATDFGYQAKRACEGEAGIEMIRQQLPDAVILDIGLPDMEGWTVLERLKGDPLTGSIPVHCFSGRDESIKALNLGAEAYYQKPASLNQIKEALTRLTGQSSPEISRLLVVEDNAVQHSTIHDLFDSSQVDVTVCTTGKEALEVLRHDQFDCVVLDLSLPDMDGYTLLETLHKDKQRLKTPVIVYTAGDLSREQEARLRKHADRIILKTDRSTDRLLSEVSLFLHWVDSNEPSSKPEVPDAGSHRNDVFSGRKVVLVDDDMRNIYALSATLEVWGCEVVVANTGQESLDALSEHPDADIVLMDIMMPEMDGYEAMQLIRAQDRFKKLPILALTAKAMKDDRARCLKAGANDYITKPIDLEKLQSLMRVWLSH